jgi:hypothetical protein
MDNTIKFNATMNTGKVVHLVEKTYREDGSTKTFLSCGQRSTNFYREHFYTTSQEVTCKKCLKLMKISLGGDL